MPRDCTRCGGFGEVLTESGNGRFGGYAVCVDCDGYGILPSEDKGQSRRGSVVETVVSTAIGFAVSLVLTAIVMPAFGYPTTWSHDFWITAIFTVASLVRGYCVRRFFEAWR